MRNGQTPIHIQRWAPADYYSDEHVRLLILERDWATLTFYRHFIDASFAAGGDLPAELRALSACVWMPTRDVSRPLRRLLGVLIFQDGDRLYQPRVRRDVAKEIEFRESQSQFGKKGGRPKTQTVPFETEKGSLLDTKSPPTPAPSPTPAPAPQEELSLPFELDTVGFREAWKDWFAYRREAKLPTWKPVTITAKLKSLAEIGSDRSIAAIRNSIENGLHGIYPAKNGFKPTGQGKAQSNLAGLDADRIAKYSTGGTVINNSELE